MQRHPNQAAAILLALILICGTYGGALAAEAQPQITHTCYFYGNSGELLHSVEVTDGGTLDPIRAPRLAGMQFSHWYEVSASMRGNPESSYSFGSPVTGSVYLKAFYQALPEATATPAPEVTATPEVAPETPVPEVTATPEAAPETPVPEVTATPEAATETPTPEVTATPEVIVEETPVPGVSATPEVVIEKTPVPEVSATPEVIVEETPVPEVSATPEVVIEETPAPEASATPEVVVEETSAPEATATPEAATETPAPEASATPEVIVEETPAPEATATPEAATETPVPEVSATPEVVIEETPVPEVSATPEVVVVEETPAPEATATPAPTEAPSATEEPGEGVPVQVQMDELYPNRKATLYMSWGSKAKPAMGDRITLSARLEGYDGIEYSLRWQVNSGGGGWQDVPDAAGHTFSFILDEKNIDWLWRVAVDIHGAAGISVQP